MELPLAGVLSWYITSQSRQLSLLPLAGQEMSTGHGTEAVPCG